MQIEEAYETLGLERPDLFASSSLGNPEGGHETSRRRTGRTTKLCVEAALLILEDKPVLWVAYNLETGKYALQTVAKFLRKLGKSDFRETQKKISDSHGNILFQVFSQRTWTTQARGFSHKHRFLFDT